MTVVIVKKLDNAREEWTDVRCVSVYPNPSLDATTAPEVILHFNKPIMMGAVPVSSLYIPMSFIGNMSVI